MSIQATPAMAPLLARLDSIRDELRELSTRREQLAEECQHLDHQLHDALIRSLVGQTVKPRFQSGLRPELKGRTGTLIECRRTRCTIDFGDAGRFTFPIWDVTHPDQPDGYAIDWREVQR